MQLAPIQQLVINKKYLLQLCIRTVTSTTMLAENHVSYQHVYTG